MKNVEQTNIINILVDYGLNLRQYDRFGMLPIMHVFKSSRGKKTISYFLEKVPDTLWLKYTGTDLQFSSSPVSYNALSFAFHFGNRIALQKVLGNPMISSNQRMMKQFNWQHLFEIACKMDTKGSVLLDLIHRRYPFDLRKYSEEGILPIMYACKEDAADAMEYLLTSEPSTLNMVYQGSDIRFQGFTALHFACYFGQENVLIRIFNLKSTETTILACFPERKKLIEFTIYPIGSLTACPINLCMKQLNLRTKTAEED